MLIRARVADDSPVLEMTPLIDTVLNLLIFFLVATTFQQVEREIQIALPLARSAGPISAALREIVINVDDTGQAIVGGRAVTIDELRTFVTDAVQANAEQKVTVRGDRACAYGAVVAVLDVCKAGGIQEPYLDTVLE
jgi:biopolymer transport protein ExbD